MPTYADFGGWVISTFAGWFVVTADTLQHALLNIRFIDQNKAKKPISMAKMRLLDGISSACH